MARNVLVATTLVSLLFPVGVQAAEPSPVEQIAIKEPVKDLLRSLFGDPDREVAGEIAAWSPSTAATAVASIGADSERVFQTLEPALQDKERSVRESAGKAVETVHSRPTEVGVLSKVTSPTAGSGSSSGIRVAVCRFEVFRRGTC